MRFESKNSFFKSLMAQPLKRKIEEHPKRSLEEEKLKRRLKRNREVGVDETADYISPHTFWCFLIRRNILKANRKGRLKEALASIWIYETIIDEWHRHARYPQDSFWKA